MRDNVRSRWGALASVVVHGLLLAGVSLAPVALGEGERTTPPEEDVVALPTMVMVALATPEPDEALDPWPETAPPREANEGEVEAPQQATRYGLRGPADNPDPHVSDAPTQAEDDLPVLVGVGGHPVSLFTDGPTAPWGRDDALGTDPRTARGRMGGEAIDDAWGRGSLAGSPSLATHGFT